MRKRKLVQFHKHPTRGWSNRCCHRQPILHITQRHRAREAQRLQQELQDARKAEQYAKGKLVQLTSTGVQNISVLSQVRTILVTHIGVTVTYTVPQPYTSTTSTTTTAAQENGGPPSLAKVEQSNHSQDDDVEALSQELEKERLDIKYTTRIYTSIG